MAVLLGTGKAGKLLQSYDTDGAAGSGTGPGVNDLLTLEEAYNSGVAIFNFTYAVLPANWLTTATSNSATSVASSIITLRVTTSALLVILAC